MLDMLPRLGTFARKIEICERCVLYFLILSSINIKLLLAFIRADRFLINGGANWRMHNYFDYNLLLAML